MIFATAFEQWRTAADLTPADVARKLDAPDSLVSRWRSGKSIPSLLYLERLSQLFGVEQETLERLAGYRASNPAGVQATIDPEMAAMLDTEKAALQEELSGIPHAFHSVILNAQRSARRVAVDSVKAAIGLAQGQPISEPQSQPISSDSDIPGRDRNREPRGPKRGLTGTYPFVAAHEHFANAQAFATA